MPQKSHAKARRLAREVLGTEEKDADVVEKGAERMRAFGSSPNLVFRRYCFSDHISEAADFVCIAVHFE